MSSSSYVIFKVRSKVMLATQTHTKKEKSETRKNILYSTHSGTAIRQCPITGAFSGNDAARGVSSYPDCRATEHAKF
jgi:hypothetical protein